MRIPQKWDPVLRIGYASGIERIPQKWDPVLRIGYASGNHARNAIGAGEAGK
jgi:hypothetical protein